MNSATPTTTTPTPNAVAATNPPSGPNGILPAAAAAAAVAATGVNPLLAASNPLYAAWMAAATFGQTNGGSESPNGQTTNKPPIIPMHSYPNGDNFQITQQKLAQFLPQQQLHQMLAMAAMANNGKLSQNDPSLMKQQQLQQENNVKQKPLWNPSIKTDESQPSSMNKGRLLFCVYDNITIQQSLNCTLIIIISIMQYDDQ